MSSAPSKASKGRRSSILKVRQTTVDTEVDIQPEVIEQPKNRRRVSFHYQKTVKEYDKEKHELSATSPLKEALTEGMSDFDSTKSNSTLMSLGTPDRTAGDDQTMNLFKGMMSGGHHSSIHREVKDMSFSIIEDPASSTSHNDTLNILNGMHSGHVSIHTKSIDISCRMEESINENAADNTLDIFRRPPTSQATQPLSNMTMEMDISRADNTLTDRAFEGDDTMAIFGGAKKMDTSIPLDCTMDVFTSGSGGSDKSRFSQSILMDMSANPSPVSSQDKTMAIFGSGSQSNESVMIVDEEKKVSPSETPLDSSMDRSKALDETQSPALNDTMAVFGSAKETGEDGIPMEMSMAVGGNGPSSQDQLPSPTMNIFKRRGDDEMDEDRTMNVFKRWSDDATLEQGGSQLKESQEINHGLQKSVLMDEEDATMNVFGVKTDETMNESVLMEHEEKKANASTVEANATNNGDRTFDCFNKMGDTSQMDLTAGGDKTFDRVKSRGDQSNMDVSGVDGTLALFGKKEEEEEQNGTFVVLEEKEKSVHETTAPINQSIIEENSIDNGSDDMTMPSPLPRKTRLSTVIEVSSRYTAASSQSMRQRVESTDESKDERILDRMDDSVHEVDEGKEMEMEEEKSERIEEESMVDSPPSSHNNTTFSATLTKRNMLDETRLSDRSMMNITRTFDELVLEKIEWMRRESEGGEMEGILKEQAIPFVEDVEKSIQRSESAVVDLLSHITQSENGDLLTKSIMKLNSSKVPEYRYLFEWARREAQREWWEKRAEKAERVNEELERRMAEDVQELMKAKEDVIMMAKLNELKEDVESLEKEVKMGRGWDRNTIDELIGESKKNEEMKEELQRKVNRLELENMKQSTVALKIISERCNANNESIKRKMEEREKNKREMRAYLSQLTNNLK